MQENQSPLMSRLPVDQPFRYDGPVGSHVFTCTSLLLPCWHPVSTFSTPLRLPTQSTHCGCLSTVSRPRTRQPLMRAATPLLLAMAPGVTSVALAHMRIRLAEPGISQHSSFPGPTSGTSGLVLQRPLSRRAPKLPCSLSHPPAPSGPLLSHLTCAICNGMPFLPVRLDPTGAPIFPPLGTLCSLTTSSTLSVSRLSLPYTSQADSMLPSRATNSLPHSPGATSLRWVMTASRTHSSRSPSQGGVIL